MSSSIKVRPITDLALSRRTAVSMLTTLVMVRVMVLAGSVTLSLVIVKSIDVPSGVLGSSGSMTTLPVLGRLVSPAPALPLTL